MKKTILYSIFVIIFASCSGPKAEETKNVSSPTVSTDTSMHSIENPSPNEATDSASIKLPSIQQIDTMKYIVLLDKTKSLYEEKISSIKDRDSLIISDLYDRVHKVSAENDSIKNADSVYRIEVMKKIIYLTQKNELKDKKLLNIQKILTNDSISE